MPQPTQNSTHVDKPLTNVSVALFQSSSNFIATQVFPRVGVQKKSDKYFIFDQNAFFRDEMQRRAPSTPSAGSGYTVSNTTYSCDVWSLHKDIDDDDRKNTDNPINQDRAATIYLTQQAMQRVERQWVSDFFTTGVWGTDVTGATAGNGSTTFTQWSNYTSSDPLEDVEGGKETILKNTGMAPNTLVLGYQAFRKLKNHPVVVDRIKYTSSSTITADMLAAMFDIDRVLVAQAIKATNNENETAAYDFIYGKSALLCYSAPNPGLETPSAGYTFMWDGVSDGLGETVAMKNIRMDEIQSDRLEIKMAFDNKAISTPLGYFFSSAVA